MRIARSKGARVFAITNCVGSRMARESDGTLYIKANMEISVAATKSFIAQISCLALIAMFLGAGQVPLDHAPGAIAVPRAARYASADPVDILDTRPWPMRLPCCRKDAHSALYVGRGIGSPICNEGALKLKEISYLHAEAYPAGEIKHGPIALIDPGFPVIAVATKSATYDKTVSNLMECKARGAKVIVVATEGDEEINKIADCIIRVPAVRDVFSPITASVPLQLLAGEVAILRGCDVDQPRNLAKSVTVE